MNSESGFEESGALVLCSGSILDLGSRWVCSSEILVGSSFLPFYIQFEMVLREFGFLMRVLWIIKIYWCLGIACFDKHGDFFYYR